MAIGHLGHYGVFAASAAGMETPPEIGAAQTPCQHTMEPIVLETAKK